MAEGYEPKPIDGTHKTLEVSDTTNGYGEIVTGLVVDNINSIIAIRIMNGTSLAHCMPSISTSNTLIIVVLDRTNSTPIANTAVSGYVIYT